MDLFRGLAFVMTVLLITSSASFAGEEAGGAADVAIQHVFTPTEIEDLAYPGEEFPEQWPTIPDTNTVTSLQGEVFDEVQLANIDSAASVSTVAETSLVDDSDSGTLKPGAINMLYYGIFYGPSLSRPNSLQPGPNGEQDPEKPVLMKNFMGLGVNLNDHINTGVVAYWQWIPVRNSQMVMKDPYLKISYEGAIQNGFLKLYSDLRYHLATSNSSRAADLKGGAQTVQILSYDNPSSDWSFSLYTSAKYNFFGARGYGYDLELYVGPGFIYQLAPHVGFTLLYEMGLNHVYGQKFGVLNNDGTDLEPGITWDITPNINVNPYINLYPGNKLSLETSSVGMLLSWKML